MTNRVGGFIGQDGLNAPDEPTAVSASAGNAQATVSFTAPSDVGGSAITGYRAQSNDGIGASASASPITVTGLTNGTTYTFRVWAINAFGWSSPSGETSSITPLFPGRALFFGGQPNNAKGNIIQYVTIATTSNALDFGDLVANSDLIAAFGNNTRSIAAGGDETNRVNRMQYVSPNSTGDTSNFGDLLAAVHSACACANSTRGIVMGGSESTGASNRIQYVTIATTGNATDFGDLTVAVEDQPGGFSSPTRGVRYGGGNSSGTIDYITIASTGNATDFGDPTEAVQATAGCASSTRGLVMGGSTTSSVLGNKNVIEYITIASTGNGTDFGDLSQKVNALAAASSETRAIRSGGYSYPSPNARTNTLEYVTIASTGNTTDFGDLLSVNSSLAGCSNAHGGIQ